MNRQAQMITARSSRLVGCVREEFQPDALVRSFASAWVIFILEAILAVSFAALVFNGPLSSYLSLGLTYFLAGNALLGLLVGFFSSSSGTVAVQQDTPSVIIALAVAGLASALALEAQGSERFATALFLILITTTGTGVIFLGIGVLRLGGLVRFLPYPVMGGFLAGTGWLLVTGGIGVMQAVSSPAALFLPDRLLVWLPGFLAGVVIVVARRRWPGPITLIVCSLLLFAGFYLAALVFRVPMDVLSAEGWLLGLFPEGAAWSFPLNSGFLAEVNWPVLLSALPGVLPAIVVGTIALLLNATGLELIIN